VETEVVVLVEVVVVAGAALVTAEVEVAVLVLLLLEVVVVVAVVVVVVAAPVEEVSEVEVAGVEAAVSCLVCSSVESRCLFAHMRLVIVWYCCLALSVPTDLSTGYFSKRQRAAKSAVIYCRCGNPLPVLWQFFE
jgi:hypothetical protein